MAKKTVTLDKNKEHEHTNKHPHLYGVGGWLLFFIFSSVIIRPIYTIYDLFANPQFYYYASGILDYGSILVMFAFIVWVIFIGVSLWLKKEKAVIWAKEFLIAELVAGIFLTLYSAGYYSAEDFAILTVDLFRGIVYFAIWFSYLSVSKRVKNTFKIRKLGWQRVLAVCGITIAAVFVLSTIAGLFMPAIENEGELLSPNPVSTTDELVAGYVNYHEFSNPGLAYDVNIDFSSDGPIEIYLVKDESDADKFIAGENFNTYSGCSREGQNSGTISCTVSTGGIIVYNPNSYDISYTLTFK